MGLFKARTSRALQTRSSNLEPGPLSLSPKVDPSQQLDKEGSKLGEKKPPDSIAWAWGLVPHFAIGLSEAAIFD